MSGSSSTSSMRALIDGPRTRHSRRDVARPRRRRVETVRRERAAEPRRSQNDPAVVPLDGRVSISIRPPTARGDLPSNRETEPEPCDFAFDRAEEPLDARSASSGDMPGPLSRTSTTTEPARPDERRSIPSPGA